MSPFPQPQGYSYLVLNYHSYIGAMFGVAFATKIPSNQCTLWKDVMCRTGSWERNLSQTSPETERECRVSITTPRGGNQFKCSYSNGLISNYSNSSFPNNSSSRWGFWGDWQPPVGKGQVPLILEFSSILLKIAEMEDLVGEPITLEKAMGMIEKSKAANRLFKERDVLPWRSSSPEGIIRGRNAGNVSSQCVDWNVHLKNKKWPRLTKHKSFLVGRGNA